MSLEKISKFFKKNAVVLIQVSVLSLPFIIFAFYYSTSENAEVLDVPVIEKVEAVAPSEKMKSVEKSESETKKTPEKALESTTFEVDEVSQTMLDSSAKNPQEMLSQNGACVTSENVRTISKHTGTISKAKNIDAFKKPLPAMITEIEYVCVDAKGEKKTKSTTMGVAVDSEANVLRCIQSNSDPEMNSEERFKHTVKIMTHHCGFKLSEHTSVAKP